MKVLCDWLDALPPDAWYVAIIVVVALLLMTREVAVK